MTETLLRLRDTTALVQPDAMGRPLQLGCLAYGITGTALTLTAPSAATAVGHATNCTSQNAVGTTNSATNGTITVARDGLYQVELNLGAVLGTGTSGATDTITFAVQKNSAGLSPAMTVTLVPESTVAGCTYGGANVRFLSLLRGDIIRATAIVANGDVVIASGSLSVTQVSDATLFTQV